LKVHHEIPFDIQKDLGKAYNEAFSRIGEDDWLIVQDYDVMPLLPQTIPHIHTYIDRNKDAGILTCYTGRISELSPQLLGGRLDENSDIKYHIKKAIAQEKFLYQTQEFKQDISGFFMAIPKKTWNMVKFPEGIGCLGVDTKWNRMVRAAGLKIILMKGIYIFHTYRIMNGVRDKQHLIA